MLVAAVITLLIWAQQTTAPATTGDVLLTLFNYGILGLGFVAVATGQLRLKREVTERDTRIEKLETVVDKYRESFEKEYIPTLTEAVRIMPEVVEALKQSDKS